MVSAVPIGGPGAPTPNNAEGSTPASPTNHPMFLHWRSMASALLLGT